MSVNIDLTLEKALSEVSFSENQVSDAEVFRMVVDDILNPSEKGRVFKKVGEEYQIRAAHFDFIARFQLCSSELGQLEKALPKISSVAAVYLQALEAKEIQEKNDHRTLALVWQELNTPEELTSSEIQALLEVRKKEWEWVTDPTELASKYLQRLAQEKGSLSLKPEFIERVFEACKLRLQGSGTSLMEITDLQRKELKDPQSLSEEEIIRLMQHRLPDWRGGIGSASDIAAKYLEFVMDGREAFNPSVQYLERVNKVADNAFQEIRHPEFKVIEEMYLFLTETPSRKEHVDSVHGLVSLFETKKSAVPKGVDKAACAEYVLGFVADRHDEDHEKLLLDLLREDHFSKTECYQDLKQRFKAEGMLWYFLENIAHSYGVGDEALHIRGKKALLLYLRGDTGLQAEVHLRIQRIDQLDPQRAQIKELAKAQMVTSPDVGFSLDQIDPSLQRGFAYEGFLEHIPTPFSRTQTEELLTSIQVPKELKDAPY